MGRKRSGELIYPTVFCTFDSFLLVYAEIADKHLGIKKPGNSTLNFIRCWTVNEIGSFVLKDIHTEMVELLLKKAALNGVSSIGVNRLRRLLHNVFELAHVLGLVRQNPCVEIHKKTESKREVVHFTDAEVRQIKQAIGEIPLNTYFETIMKTGLRMDICSALTVDCLDEDKNLLYIGQKMTYEHCEPKLTYFTDNCYEIHIPDSSVLQLKKEKKIQDRKRMSAGAKWSNPDRLFFTDYYGCSLKQTDIAKQYVSLRRMSGVEDLSMRTLRSNYLVRSFMTEGGFTAALAQTGFANISSVLPYYYEATRYLRKENANQLMERLENDKDVWI